MWLIVLLGVVGFGLWALQRFATNVGPTDSRWPVVARPVLTEREQVLYQRLVAAFPDHVVLAQVAVSQIVAVRRDVPQWQALQNRFFRLVADFVLCRRDFSVVAVIEIDDFTHLRADRQDADARKTKAIEDAGLRMLRIGSGALPSIDALRRQLQIDVPNANPTLVDRSEMPKPPDSEWVAVLRPIIRVALAGVLIIGGWIVYSRVIAMAVPAIILPRPFTAPTTQTLVMPAGVSTNTNTAVEQAEQRRLQAQRALDAQMAGDAAAKRKSQAWATYYRAPKSCDDPPTWAAQVECGNEYMRAKKAFEKDWGEKNLGQ